MDNLKNSHVNGYKNNAHAHNQNQLNQYQHYYNERKKRKMTVFNSLVQTYRCFAANGHVNTVNNHFRGILDRFPQYMPVNLTTYLIFMVQVAVTSQLLLFSG